ncbi:MAG: GTP cyclohydrolase I FolE [Gallionella sp.]
MNTGIKKVYHVGFHALEADVEKLAGLVKAGSRQFDNIYGVPRGGTIVAMLLSRHLKLPLIDAWQITPKTLIVDDLIDSGATMKKFSKDVCRAVLYKKPYSPDVVNCWVREVEDWIEFFYENTAKDIADNVTRILEYIGENPNREGLKDTPHRVVRMYGEIFGGYAQDPENLFKAVFTSDVDEMVIIRDIPFFSHCEHHMVPFFGKCHIAYLPKGKVLGLSKFSRLVEIYAKRLQIQEHLTKEIADAIDKHLKPAGVAVVIEARHLCTEMRGVKKHNNTTITSVTKGSFRENPQTRNEFLTLIGRKE